MSNVDLALASQAQFYFDALWAGALGLTETLGQYFILLFTLYLYVPLFHTSAVHNASDFSYDPEMASAKNFTTTLYSNIRAVNFRGMSVRLKKVVIIYFLVGSDRELRIYDRSGICMGNDYCMFSG